MRATGDLSRQAYYSSLLTPPQRELAFLTAAVVNDCHY
jgi:hypothetical protein